MSVTFSSTVPVLRSFDEPRAKEFYVDFLGFEVTFEHRFAPDLPLYMGLRRGSCELHVTEHHGDACPGSHIRMEVAGLDEFQKQLAAKKYRHSRPGPPKDTPFGEKQLGISDPFGNRITFFEKTERPA